MCHRRGTEQGPPQSFGTGIGAGIGARTGAGTRAGVGGAVPNPLPAPSPASPLLAVPAALSSPRRNPFWGRDVSFNSPWEAPRASQPLFVAGSPAFEASRGLRKATPSFPFHGRSGTGLPANSSGLGSELYITANYTQNRIREEFPPLP